MILLNKLKSERRIFVATEVYKFRITYEGLKDIIWREVEISSRYFLNQFGYCILATFDTRASHLFLFSFEENTYVIPFDENQPTKNIKDMAEVRMENLHMQIGQQMKMIYDFGIDHVFNIELLEISPMKRGHGTHYPYITNGSGRGIIEGLDNDELLELIRQIDENGKTNEEIYYHEYPWTYKDYDIDCDNGLLKGTINYISDDYYGFWEDDII